MAENLYASLADFKRLKAIPSTSADTADDDEILRTLEAASRYIDGETARRFYPEIDTRYFDWPDGNNERRLWLDDDLLEVTTFVNGDGTSFESTDYYPEPRGRTPFYALTLKEATDATWETDSDENTEQVLAVTGPWGYHERYGRAWRAATTLGAAMTDTTTASFTAADGTLLSVGDIVKVDTEVMNVSAISTNTVTVTRRGDCGSTAATHLIAAAVYVWTPDARIRDIALNLARNSYSRRFGENTIAANVKLTAAGVVIEPQDVGARDRETLRSLYRAV